LNAHRDFLQSYGPWAVVTGASSGIGEAFARALAARGLNLVLVARRQDRLNTIAGELEGRHRIETAVIATDLADAAGTALLLARTAPLDAGLLVQAAGFGTAGDYLSIPAEEELSMVDLNCRTVQHLARRFGERFADRGRGGIILLSSIVAFQGTPRSAAYAASKAFVQSLAEGIAPDLAARGVDVLASAPGPVRSGFAGRANMIVGGADSPEIVAAQTLAALGRRNWVTPGALGKVLSGSLSMLPRRARSVIMGRVMVGMTKHQNAQKT
jgi:short-subunit dehydrogenase